MSCAECKPPPPPPKPAPEPRAAKSPAAKPSVNRIAKTDDDGEKKGPKAMLPRKSRPKRVNDRAEAEAAEAWWVKKGGK